ncbi:MAG: thiamine phosphate synthase [Victivallales bacterium]|jgi:thiamine-phosphate pyrophosphorylase
MKTKEKRLAAFDKIDIYPVISSEFCAGRDPLYVLEQIAEGGAKIVQLREKNKSMAELVTLACEFRRICDRHGMLLIINDLVDVALAAGADGVHLGQGDLPIGAAREAAPEMIFGISTHSAEEALKAQSAGADYVNIGPIFNTQTKSLTMAALGVDVIGEIAPLLHIPFTVMGGIKSGHMPELLSAGARKIAMVTEITANENIAAKVRDLRKMML